MPRPVTTTISAYRDGPLLVRGPVTIVDEDGQTLEVRRAVVPLCRCGRSRAKPLCDGTHAVLTAKNGNGARDADAVSPPVEDGHRDTAPRP